MKKSSVSTKNKNTSPIQIVFVKFMRGSGREKDPCYQPPDMCLQRNHGSGWRYSGGRLLDSIQQFPATLQQGLQSVPQVPWCWWPWWWLCLLHRSQWCGAVNLTTVLTATSVPHAAVLAMRRMRMMGPPTTVPHHVMLATMMRLLRPAPP